MADRTELTGLTLELDHKYSIGPAVQRGPMATMYRATWTLFELPVYVRFYESLIALRLAHRDATRIRWAIEGEAGRVRGEHLPDAIDTGIHGAQQPFLVVRIPRGETLQDRLSAQGPLPLEDAVELTRAMASALRDCRDQAQPHRGPTMDRVWCGEDGSYTLLGYGEVLYRDETLRIRGRSCTELLWHIPPESFRATQSEAGEPSTRSQSLRMSARNPASHADRRIEESGIRRGRDNAVAVRTTHHRCRTGARPMPVQTMASSGLWMSWASWPIMRKLMMLSRARRWNIVPRRRLQPGAAPTRRYNTIFAHGCARR